MLKGGEETLYFQPPTHHDWKIVLKIKIFLAKFENGTY